MYVFILTLSLAFRQTPSPYRQKLMHGLPELKREMPGGGENRQIPHQVPAQFPDISPVALAPHPIRFNRIELLA
jgi:hypothetical protein